MRFTWPATVSSKRPRQRSSRAGGLVQQTAAGEDLSIDLLGVHAEDQLMSAEGFGILAKEFVDVYRKMGA
mgnify:CR=1 FL=1